MKASPHPCLVTSPLRGLAYGLLAKFNEAYARQEERLLADVTPNYSGKLENEQNTIRQGKKQEYQRTLKDFLKPVPSRFTDIKLTGDVELSAVELMTVSALFQSMNNCGELTSISISHVTVAGWNGTAV